MEIDLLYIPDCPHRSHARHYLDVALRRTRGNAVIREREICSQEEAARVGMTGSPTILVDGRDPFADPAAAPALACRLYRTDVGFSGVPSVEQLVEALGS